MGENEQQEHEFEEFYGPGLGGVSSCVCSSNGRIYSDLLKKW
jgi:hypothetical protein